jgi:DNA-binding MarR family transcriptional regulator
VAAAGARGAGADDVVEQIEVGIRQVIAFAVLFNYEVAERTGMNIRDAQVLGLCQLHGPLTAGQIATLAQLPSATVTGVVDRLEGLRMVRRERDPKDRRKVIVEVDNEALYAQLGPYYVEQSARLREVLSAYSARQQLVIRDFLGDIIAAQPGQAAPPTSVSSVTGFRSQR